VRSLQLLLEACAAIVQTFAQKYALRTSTRAGHKLQDLEAGVAIVHEREACDVDQGPPRSRIAR